MADIGANLLAPRPGWRQGELFEGISGESFRCVEHCLGAKIVSFERSDTVLSQDEGATRIGVLLDGVGLDAQQRANGSGMLVDVIEPGDLFGDGWGDSGPDSARALVAAECGRALILDASRLVEGYSACEVRPRLVDNLLRAVLRKERRLRDHLDLVTRRSLRERLSHYLLSQRERYGRAQFTIPLSRAELAEYLHADRTALSRELSRMQDESLISFYRNSFVVRELPGIDATAA